LMNWLISLKVVFLLYVLRLFESSMDRISGIPPPIATKCYSWWWFLFLQCMWYACFPCYTKYLVFIVINCIFILLVCSSNHLLLDNWICYRLWCP
jgi:hypothetical protein